MTTPRILALDTTTEACSVAFGQGDEVVSRWEHLPRGHSARILPMIDEVLAEAGVSRRDLDVLAFCRGPGSFTGVRIATGVVQGMAYALDLPVVPVSTLAAIAEGAHCEHGADHVAAAIDARMKQVYWGEYELGNSGLMELVGEERVVDPTSVELASKAPVWAAGTGFGSYGEILCERLGVEVVGVEADRLPKAVYCLDFARAAYEAGNTVAAMEAIPVYLRDKVTN